MGICKYEGGSVVLTIINVAHVLSTGLDVATCTVYTCECTVHVHILHTVHACNHVHDVL